MMQVTPVTGADLSAISPPVKYGGTTVTAGKTAAAKCSDIISRITANSISHRLIRWIPSALPNAGKNDGFWVVHQTAADTVTFAAPEKGRGWFRYDTIDTPGEYGVWLTAGAVVDVAEMYIDHGNRGS